MSARTLVSVCIPVYNEQTNVRPAYEAIVEVFRPLSAEYELELVFTDNCSTDGTFDALAALAAADPRVRVFRFARNVGFQRSVYTGLLLARGEVAFQLDVDLQDPPALLPTFLDAWRRGHDVVYGVRRSRKEGLAITLARRLFYRLIDLLSEERLPLDAGDFRLVSRRVLDVLRRIDDQRPYLRGTLATLGFSQLGIPYDRAARARGESKFSLKDLVGLALDGILSHSIVPLRVATFTGLGVTSLTLVMGLYYTVKKLFFGVDWPPGFATITVLLLGSLAVNATFLGVIGEYVGRIYREARWRPLSVIEAKIDAYGSAAGARGVLDVTERPKLP